LTNEPLERFRTAIADRYSIESELGSGGMATVYLARDIKHDRKVALKVLRPDLSAVVGAERFLAEIKVTARLSHPHILALHDSGEAAGLLFYVMPFVEGETLRQRMDREGRIALDDAIRITRDVLDALDYAHRREVIHRDIKPENVLLQGSYALLADFGIARAVGEAGSARLTQTGMLLGTPMYMSPEQASGEFTIDGRSDVYSVACVLYEMLTGQPPFAGGSTQAIIARRFVGEVPSATEKNPEIPAAVDSAMQKAMLREPEGRLASAATFGELLGAAITSAATGQFVPAKVSKEPPRIAVLPFANMSPDPDAEFLSNGIAEELLNTLARLTGVRVVARTSSFAFKDRNIDVREIGQLLSAHYVLEGGVRKAGSKLRITSQLIDTSTGDQLWSGKYDREMTDVFAVQDELSEAIRDELAKHVLGIGKASSKQSRGTIDPETYEMFLRGRYLVDQRVDGMQKGMEILQQVVAKAPGFAPGYAALGNAFATLGYYCFLPSKQAYQTAQGLARQALGIDPTNPLAQVVAGHCAFFMDWDWPTALYHYSRAAELAPNDWFAASTLALYFVSVGRFDEAIATAKRGVNADPLNPSALIHLALIQHLARKYEDCVATCDKIIEIAPVFSESYRWKGLSLHHLGRSADGLDFVEHAAKISNRHVWSLANVALLQHALGRLNGVDATMSELEKRAAAEPIPHYALALSGFRTAKPNKDVIFAALDKSVEARDFWLVMTRAEPFFDHVRDDPRYDALVKKIGIPEFRK
jgi:serine/threonine protein kinase/tetratricopeptide (TPR) repeat protein